MKYDSCAAVIFNLGIPGIYNVHKLSMHGIDFVIQIICVIKMYILLIKVNVTFYCIPLPLN